MKVFARGWFVLVTWLVWPPGYLLASILYWAVPDQCAVDSCGPPVAAMSQFQTVVARTLWTAWCMGILGLPLLLTGLWWRRRRAGRSRSGVHAV
jgi:hypothetical protein